MSNFKSTAPWAYRLAMCGLVLAGLTILVGSPIVVPAASAQVVISINPPVCIYGYYEYEPYGCAPMGFYGPGYFYNGIFLGVGPWSNWGYNHGWGGHRFNGGGGGRYIAGHRDDGGRGGNRGGTSHAAANRGGASHGSAARGGGASRGTASHASPARSSGGASHASASHASGGGASRGGGGAHGGGGASHGGGGGGGHR